MHTKVMSYIGETERADSMDISALYNAAMDNWLNKRTSEGISLLVKALTADTRKALELCAQEPLGSKRNELFIEAIAFLSRTGQKQLLGRINALIYGRPQDELSMSGITGIPELSDDNHQYNIALLQRTVSQHPDNGDAWYALGVQYAGTGQSGEALGAMIRALNIDPRKYAMALISGGIDSQGSHLFMAILDVLRDAQLDLYRRIQDAIS